MCGIIAVNGLNIKTKLIESLRRLEYRGYDSAGIAFIDSNKDIVTYKTEGKVDALRNIIEGRKVEGEIGIGHTRWATHGIPSDLNAHPHSTGKTAVVHNGIIENYDEIKKFLQKKDYDYKFISQTDTEVICVLIDYFIERENLSKMNAVLKASNMFEGNFAFVAIFSDERNLMIAAKKGSPLVVGVKYKNDTKSTQNFLNGSKNNISEIYLSSDAVSIVHLTKNILYLEDGEIVEIKDRKVSMYNFAGEAITGKTTSYQQNLTDVFAETEQHNSHFILKEIYEQPTVIARILENYTGKDNLPSFPGIKCDLSQYDKIFFVACGSSFYAANTASYYLESLGIVDARVEIASEFRYKHSFSNHNNEKVKSLYIFISQSGETADTVASLKMIKAAGGEFISLVNSENNTMTMLSSNVIYCKAGAEISVASTKAFTAQLGVLILLTLKIGLAKGKISEDIVKKHVGDLQNVAKYLTDIITDLSVQISNIITPNIINSEVVIFVGRGAFSHIAYEGALKLKELAYIPSDGIAAGELKHGPIALLDENTTVVALCPEDSLADKTLSNVHEIAARQANIIAITNNNYINRLESNVKHKLLINKDFGIANIITYTVPLQLFAYYLALAKGCNIDQPRNLAKSVTVE